MEPRMIGRSGLNQLADRPLGHSIRGRERKNHSAEQRERYEAVPSSEIVGRHESHLHYFERNYVSAIGLRDEDLTG